MARYCDPDANVQSGERFAEQSMLNTPLPRLSTDSIGGLSSPTVNWNHTRLRLQNLVFCGANACSDRKVLQLAGYLSAASRRIRPDSVTFLEPRFAGPEHGHRTDFAMSNGTHPVLREYSH